MLSSCNISLSSPKAKRSGALELSPSLHTFIPLPWTPFSPKTAYPDSIIPFSGFWETREKGARNKDKKNLLYLKVLIWKTLTICWQNVINNQFWKLVSSCLLYCSICLCIFLYFYNIPNKEKSTIFFKRKGQLQIICFPNSFKMTVQTLSKIHSHWVVWVPHTVWMAATLWQWAYLLQCASHWPSVQNGICVWL